MKKGLPLGHDNAFINIVLIKSIRTKKLKNPMRLGFHRKNLPSDFLPE